MTPLTHRSNFYKNPTHMQGARKVIAYFEAEVLTQTDYYPFGSVMPERQLSAGAEGYRYGFNDDEPYGKGNALYFGARIYDSRLGRFISLDPLAQSFSSQSGYVGFNNSPLLFNDPTGESGVVTIIPAQGEGRPMIKITTKITLYGGAIESQQNALKDELDRTYNGKHEIIDPASGKPFMSEGKPLTANSLNTIYLDGLEYDLIFEFEVNINNALTKEEVLANNDVSQNYLRVVSDDAVPASKFNTNGNSGVIKKGDIFRKSKTSAHEILHGYTGNNHPVTSKRKKPIRPQKHDLNSTDNFAVP